MSRDYVSLLQHISDSLPHLTTQQQQAARYLLEHPHDVGLRSMRSIAAQAEVKPATISRLCRKLGFKDYESFKLPFIQRLRKSQPGYVSQLEDVQRRGSTDLFELYAEGRAQDIANIENSVSDEQYAILFDAAETIRASRRVYVLGFRGPYSAAFLFHYTYQLFRENSQLVNTNAGIFADQFRGMNSDDCLLVISFDPYTKMTIDAINYAADAGVKIIAITDKLASPVTRSASHIIVTQNKSTSFYQSLTGALAVNHALITFLVANTGSNAIQILKEAEEQMSNFSVYW